MQRLADISQFESLMNSAGHVFTNNSYFHLPVSHRCYHEGIQGPNDFEDIRKWVKLVEDPWYFEDVDDYPYWIRDEIRNKIGSTDYCPDSLEQAVEDVLKEGKYEEKLKNWMENLSELDKERLRLYNYVTEDNSLYSISEILGEPNHPVPESWKNKDISSGMWGEDILDIDSLYKNINQKINQKAKERLLWWLANYHSKKGERLSIPDWIQKNQILDKGYPEKNYWDHNTKAPGYPIKKKLIQAVKENKDKFGLVGDENQADVLEEVIRALGDDAYDLPKIDRLVAFLTLHKNPDSRDRAKKLEHYLKKLRESVDYGTREVARLEDELSTL